jgi:UPF0148 protein
MGASSPEAVPASPVPAKEKEGAGNPGNTNLLPAGAMISLAGVSEMGREDEIMAGYLLKGGKMLAKCCQVCGCPLFEYKGDTRCVVCAEMKSEQGKEPAGSDAKADVGNEVPQRTARHSDRGEDVHAALENAIICICGAAASESDPQRCAALMEAVKTGVTALRLLDQP